MSEMKLRWNECRNESDDLHMEVGECEHAYPPFLGFVLVVVMAPQLLSYSYVLCSTVLLNLLLVTHQDDCCWSPIKMPRLLDKPSQPPWLGCFEHS
jgi:hypothetical protein